MATRETTMVSSDWLWTAYASRPDLELREMLVERYKPMAMAVLRQLLGRWDEDMEQVALIGLIKAIDRFDPSCGRRFSTFAIPTIRGELQRYLRDQSRLVRCPRPLFQLRHAVMVKVRELTIRTSSVPTLAEVASAMGVELDRVTEAMAVEDTCHPCSLDGLRPVRDGDSSATLEHFLGADDPEWTRVEERVAWKQLLDTLNPRLKRVIELRYFRNLSQQETGRRLGVTQMQVSRLERRALERLRGLAAAGAA